MSGNDKEEDGYTTVRIPKELSDEIEKLVGKKGFRSKAEIVKVAIRDFLNHYHVAEIQMLPRFEPFNHDTNGVKILDRQAHRIADIYFRRDGIWCDLDKTNMCEHIHFALSEPDVQEIIRKKRKEGWKLPEV
jgi:hypothetical protein